MDVFRSSLDLDAYRTLLEAFYGYYSPLEQRLDAANVRTQPSLGFAPLWRAPLLERDLIALETAPERLATLPRCVHLPTITIPAEMAGCFYVIEGASLGGRVISGWLERRLGIGRHNGGSFFFGEGPRTLARWHAVLDWIEQLALDEESTETIVESACDTFRTIARWLEPTHEPV